MAVLAALALQARRSRARDLTDRSSRDRGVGRDVGLRHDRHVGGLSVRSQSIPAQALRMAADSGESMEFHPDRTLRGGEDAVDGHVRRERSVVRSHAGRTRVSLQDGSMQGTDLSRFAIHPKYRQAHNGSGASSSADAASTEDALRGRCRVCTLPNPCARHLNPMTNGTAQRREGRNTSSHQGVIFECNSESAEEKRKPRSQSTSAVPNRHAGPSQSGSLDADWKTCTICFGDFSADDPPASQADSLRHGIKFTCAHAAAFHLSCLQQEAQQVRTFHCPLCRSKFGFSAFCICGAELVAMQADDPDVYGGSGVRCDHCCVNVPGDCQVYHCPKAKSEMHPNGYDVCRQCAGKELWEQPMEEAAPSESMVAEPRADQRVEREVFAAMLAADRQEWECPACTLLNDASAVECAACTGSRPSLQSSLQQAGMSLQEIASDGTHSQELRSLLQQYAVAHRENNLMRRLLASRTAEAESLLRSLTAATVASESDEQVHPNVQGNWF